MDDIEVVIGIDAHKRTHTMVAVDAMGRELATKTIAATSDGHIAALKWAAQWPSKQWAVEDCRHLTRTLERDMLRAGQQLVRVPIRLMAETRRSARQPGKSDPIDAAAVARAAWRHDDLPVAALDGPQRELRLLVDHRDDLVCERTRAQSPIRWHLHELDPGLQIRPRGLRCQKTIDELRTFLAGRHGLLVELCVELLERIEQLNHRARDLERQITTLVHRLAPALLEIVGCGPLSAAKIIGESAGISRFRSKSAYARWNGTAPQPVWSGNRTRFRLTRSGNRQVNAALHRIALTQAARPSLGRDYLDRRVRQGATKTEALRLLRRRLSDVVYRTLLAEEDHPNNSTHNINNRIVLT